jgi:hypothetical protein
MPGIGTDDAPRLDGGREHDGVDDDFHMDRSQRSAPVQ